MSYILFLIYLFFAWKSKLTGDVAGVVFNCFAAYIFFQFWNGEKKQ